MVWTSHSKSNGCGLHHIPTCAQEDWHLLLTMRREACREECICQADPEATGWSRSKETGISSLLNMKHRFLFKHLSTHWSGFCRERGGKQSGSELSECPTVPAGDWRYLPDVFCSAALTVAQRVTVNTGLEEKITQIDISAVDWMEAINHTINHKTTLKHRTEHQFVVVKPSLLKSQVSSLRGRERRASRQTLQEFNNPQQVSF